MKIFSLSTLFLFLIIITTWAQEKNVDAIGHYFDIDHENINGYLDFDYEAKKSFEISFVIGQEFTSGYYYDLNNHKQVGLLKYSQMNKFFIFKEDWGTTEKIIKPKDCLGYVIGADSFLVMDNFKIEGVIGKVNIKKPDFVEYLDKAGQYTFYKHIRENDLNITYLVKMDSSGELMSFPKSFPSFKDVALKVFSEYPAMINNIKAWKYSEKDIPAMIKLLKYKLKYDINEPIYFNAFWDEVETKENSKYHATIDLKADTVFHLEYFEADIPLFEGFFTSFFPHEKTGDFSWYYPNGTIRKKTTYTNNKAIKTITFYANGKVHQEYNNSNKKPLYKKVYNSEGIDVLDNNGNGKMSFYDSIVKREIVQVYSKNRLIQSYYTDANNRRIYQHCKNNAFINDLSILKNDFKTANRYPENAINNNAHGYVLVRVLVEPTGLVTEIDVVKGIDPECDNVALALSFMKKRYCWTPAKADGKKVTQELIIPIRFSLEGFSRYRYNDHFLMKHMQMQMHHQQNIQHISPPRF